MARLHLTGFNEAARQKVQRVPLVRLHGIAAVAHDFWTAHEVHAVADVKATENGKSIWIGLLLRPSEGAPLPKRRNRLARTPSM